MSSLAPLMWLGVMAALVRLGGKGNDVHFLAAFGSCLLAVMAESGHMESGRGSRWRRPTQVTAVMCVVTYVIMACLGISSFS